MEDTLRNYLLQYSRLLPRCQSRLKDLTREDFVKKTADYINAMSYMEKLEKIYKDILSCTKEAPGILTGAQINSISDSMQHVKTQITELQTNSIVEEKADPVEVQSPTPDIELPKKKSGSEFESLSLKEMRSLLKLDVAREPISDNTHDSEVHNAILDEIHNSTARLKDMGDELHQRVVSSNTTLDEIQELQDRNLAAVSKEKGSIKKVSTNSWSSLFFNLKVIALVIPVVVVCFFIIVVLPKLRL